MKIPARARGKMVEGSGGNGVERFHFHSHKSSCSCCCIVPAVQISKQNQTHILFAWEIELCKRERESQREGVPKQREGWHRCSHGFWRRQGQPK